MLKTPTNLDPHETCSTEFRVRTPRPRPGGIARQRLHQQLDAGSRSGVTLVSAPAGYGKTTLVAGWARRRDEPTLWVSLESRDDDLRRFRALLAAGLRPVFPGSTKSTLLAKSTIPMAPERVAQYVQDVVDDRPLILVLDDLHAVASPEIMDTLTSLVQGGIGGLHLVLLTRVDPPLPWVRWMAGGQLVLIGQTDLAFRADEAAAFLDETMGIAVEAAAVEEIVNRTEGWAAGLQLAALSLVKSSSTGACPINEGGKRWVTKYLMTEALAGLPSPLVTFLLEVSLAPRLTASLCNAMRGAENSQELLQEAASRNLFLSPLDADGEWWRFHALFQAFLQGELQRRREPPAVAALCERAATWFHSAAEPEPAILLACRSENWRLAMDILEPYAWSMLSRGEAMTIARWFEKLPRQHLVSRRDLASTVGLILFVEAEWYSFIELFERMRSTEGWRKDPRFTVLEGSKWLIERRPDKALECLGRCEAPDRASRFLASWQLGLCLAAESRFEEADAVLDQVIKVALTHGDAFGAVAACSLLVDTGLLRGRIAAAERRLLEVRAAIEARAIETTSAKVHLLMSEAAIASERGNWAIARSLINQALEDSKGHNVAIWMRVLDPARRLLAGQGRFDEARLLAASVRTLLRPTGAYGTVIAHAVVGATHYEGMFDRADDRAEAIQIADRFGPPEDAHLLMTIEGARDRFVRLAIRAEMAAGRMGRAARRIADLREQAVAGSWRRTLMDLDLFEAQLAIERGEHDVAELYAKRCLDELTETSMFHVALAGPRRASGLVCAFAADRVSEVPELEILLAPQGGPESRRLESCRTENSAARVDEAGLRPKVLSSRELEVLALAAEGESNRDIAERLIMSPHTVKKHLENIYRKLGARSRSKAVVRARGLGLLPPPEAVLAVAAGREAAGS